MKRFWGGATVERVKQGFVPFARYRTRNNSNIGPVLCMFATYSCFKAELASLFMRQKRRSGHPQAAPAAWQRSAVKQNTSKCVRFGSRPDSAAMRSPAERRDSTFMIFLVTHATLLFTGEHGFCAQIFISCIY